MIKSLSQTVTRTYGSAFLSSILSRKGQNEFMNSHSRCSCQNVKRSSFNSSPFLSLTSGQGLLSQSALQLNNQDAYAAAGYHSNQGLTLGETVSGRSGQVGGAVHSYNQVRTHELIKRFLCPGFSFLRFIFSLLHFHPPHLLVTPRRFLSFLHLHLFLLLTCLLSALRSLIFLCR